MPYQAGNAVPVTPGWTPQATFQWAFGSKPQGAVKLDTFVTGTDVIVQVLEHGEAWQDDVTQEILLRNGFNSRPFETPFVAWRFKVWAGTVLAQSGTVDFVALA